MNSLKPWQSITLAILVALGLGYSFGRYAQPAKEVIKTVEVVKTVETVKHDTVTVTKQIKKPDGTTETDTTTTDKDIETSKTNIAESSSETITNVKPQWKATGLLGYNVSTFEKVYGAEIERRIIGPIFVGAWANTQRTGGVSVSIEF
jgi:hypothetical protein